MSIYSIGTIATIFLSHLLSTILCNEYTCNIYKCSIYEIKYGQCVYPHITNTTSNQITFEIDLKCPAGTHCNNILDTNQNRTCLTPQPPMNGYLEGEYCASNKDCASKKCNNNKCEGLHADVPCDNHDQCTVGYYCGRKTVQSVTSVNCLSQKAHNQTCSSDYECLNNMGCFNNLCTPYFSLPDGARGVSNDMFCKNYKTIQQTCVTSKINQTDYECHIKDGNIQTNCVFGYTGIGDGVYYDASSKCQCSRGYSNKNFCEMDTMNIHWQRMVKQVKSFYNHEAMNMHTVARHKYSDIELRRTILTTRDYPIYRDADLCALDIDANSEFMKYSLTFIIAIFILFV